MSRHRWTILTMCAAIVVIGLTSLGLGAQDATHDLFLISLKVQGTKANGSSWDPAGGKPDLRVILSNERSGKTFLSTVAKDTSPSNST